jgi:hypothetical protein
MTINATLKITLHGQSKKNGFVRVLVIGLPLGFVFGTKRLCCCKVKKGQRFVPLGQKAKCLACHQNSIYLHHQT